MTGVRSLALALGIATAAVSPTTMAPVPFPPAPPATALDLGAGSPRDASSPLVPDGVAPVAEMPRHLDQRLGPTAEPAPLPPDRPPEPRPAGEGAFGIPADAALGPGSEAILRACWGEGQLAASEPEQAIQGRPRANREPPPSWAVQAAASSAEPLPGWLRGSIRGVEPADPEARLIALTFDLCEGPNERSGYDGRIVDWLRANGVKATFFASGTWMRDHPERTLRLMADPLFELGNHGWTHGNLRVLQGAAARDQILWTQAEYQVLREALRGRPCAGAVGVSEWERIPAWPTLFRFPFGACDEGSLGLAAGRPLVADSCYELSPGDNRRYDRPSKGG